MLELLDAAAVHEALPHGPLIEALRKGFDGSIEAPVRHHHDIPRPGASPAVQLLMPAWRPGAVTGVKLAHVCAGNEALGLPTVQGLYVLFDGPTGTPRAVLDGAALTQRRTACASALAADYLARKDSRTLLVIGAGAVARQLVGAHRAVRPGIERVLVWNRTPERALAFAAEFEGQDFSIEATSDLAAALAEADIVAAATLSTEPIVKGQDVRPGTHVDLVGAFKPTMRESDDALMARASLFVDTRGGALAEAGDILQAIASGAIAGDAIRADLFDLVAGRHPGRRNDEEITVFKSVGASLEDLAAAELALARHGQTAFAG